MEGIYYSINGSRSYNFWSRYLDFFEKVYIVARCKKNNNIDLPDSSMVEGNNIQVIPLTNYQGPYQYLKIKKVLINEIESIDLSNKSVILRAPGQLSNIFFKILNKINFPYAVELVGDPYDVFTTKYNLLKLYYRYSFYQETKDMVKNAKAVSYVTKQTLQKRYPTNGYSTNISSVNLPKSFFSIEPKTYIESNLEEDFNIISIGGMDQMYKGFDTLLESFGLLTKIVPHAKITIIGDGINKYKLERLAKEIGIQDKVIFTGQVQSGNGIREYLIKSDLFVLASRTEGLPRVVIEAMAVGLPCIATNVGGIPELLEKDFLVYPDAPNEIKEKILYLYNNPNEMNGSSKRNLHVSKEYDNGLLKERRIKFFEQT